MTDDALKNYLEDVLRSFVNYRRLAENAMSQVSDSDFFRTPESTSNSIAIIVKHIAGNQRSRWREFLTTDGEKPDRHRDTEFEIIDDSRESLMNAWNNGWELLFDSIGSLNSDDLSKTVSIRGETHTVVEAINRQLTHYAYHIGQLTFLAKHFCGEEWQTLSVPRNMSNEFNNYLKKKKESGLPMSHPLRGPEEFAAASKKKL